MRLPSLFNRVVILITFYVSTLEVFAVEIGCESIKNCALAKHILSKRYLKTSPEVWSLFKISKCGYEKESNEFKIWCPKFKSCRTTTNEIDSEIHVCCPWPAQASQDEIVHTITLGKKGNSRRIKRQTYQPFFALKTNGNNFYDDGQNKHFTFGDFGNFESEKPNFDFPDFGLKSKQNIFAQQNTNFYDYLKSGQMNNMNELQNSLQKQTKWFQGALQHKTKELTESQQNFTNKLKNSWKGSTKKHVKDRYNLTEETFESAQEVCLTPDNFEGICKLIRECPTFVKAINDANSTDVNQTMFLKKFRCGTDENNDIKVCCTENAIVLPVPITKVVQPRTENQDSTKHNLDSLSSICGLETIDDKIIGGTTTGLAEFPWTAVLYYTTPKGVTFACGGSVISNRYIITAAHCVNSNILNQAGLLNLKQIVLGEYDRKNDTDCIYTKYGSECADLPQSFGVEQIIEHELFKSNATQNDIALVRLDRNITFSDFIRPICLPTNGSINLKENETVTITGWGRTESGQPSEVKRKARLPFVSKDNCGQLGPLAKGQMCLGSGNGIDSCRGDSGGPVMMHTIRTSNDLVSTLVGIISFGFGRCGTTTSVSTYVPHYLDWIFKNTS